jgi:hypothetical protein
VQPERDVRVKRAQRGQITWGRVDLDLHRVVQDGTRIRASAAASFRSGETLERLMTEAQRPSRSPSSDRHPAGALAAVPRWPPPLHPGASSHEALPQRARSRPAAAAIDVAPTACSPTPAQRTLPTR